jgi:broad specificity phosphatase PhoE
VELYAMKQVLLTIFLLLGLPCLADAPSDLFTVYLVRHAEKQTDQNDPPLTECGTQRAQGLAQLLRSVNLEHVYSSDYKRTLRTAAAVADSQNLQVELYDPGKLEEIKVTLLNRKQDALVVGHGNTTAVLAGMLATQELEETEYHSYDRIYQVVVFNNTARVHLLHDTFQCGE